MGARSPHRLRRLALSVFAGLGLVWGLTGCSSETSAQIKRLALPEPASKQAWYTYHLWQWSWLAVAFVGALVWGLILFAVIRYRRRSEDFVPVQVRYHLPIEILYTVAPVIMVIAFFFYTVKVQHEIQRPERATHTVDVVGQQWSWTFNYVKPKEIGGQSVWEAGTTAQDPTLYLPVNQPVRINLSSPDVIHSFWVPPFLFKEDVIPGRHNHFTFTPDRIGTYAGRCAELCGVYHSRMLFNVKVVKEADFVAEMKKLKAAGNTGLAMGGSQVHQQPGLESNGGE